MSFSTDSHDLTFNARGQCTSCISHSMKRYLSGVESGKINAGISVEFAGPAGNIMARSPQKPAFRKTMFG